MSGSRTFTFLGTGTSVGVPMIGCGCAVCQSVNPRNHRYRCSVVITTPRGRILVDTPPELRLQLLRANIPFVHAVVYTHYHADHLFGLDDVRLFPRHLGQSLPIYCSEETEQVIRQAFSYAFAQDNAHLPAGFVPQLDLRRVNTDAFRVLDESVLPIPLIHSRFKVNGYRIGDVAYCTDVSEIPPESKQRLQNLDVLVLDCLRMHPHPAHLSLDQALALIAELRPKRAYLTHISHDLDYDMLNPRLPAGVEMAYDGLTFTF